MTTTTLLEAIQLAQLSNFARACINSVSDSAHVEWAEVTYVLQAFNAWPYPWQRQEPGIGRFHGFKIRPLLAS